MPSITRLLIWCPDRTGIIAATSGFLAELGANIIEADQHTDPDDGTFCMRLEFNAEGTRATRDELRARWSALAERFRMQWQIAWAAQQNSLHPADASATKAFGTEYYLEALRSLMEILGQGGYVPRGSTAEQLHGQLEQAYRGLLILTFGGGTNELQRDIIAMFGLGMPRADR